MTPPTWLYWPAAAAAWVPSDLADLVVWLDADDTAFSNNDPVDAWTNKGSGGNTAQSDSAKRPVFKTNLLNGKPGVDFDGSNDCLQISSVSLDAYISVFFVAKGDSGTRAFFLEHSSASFGMPGFYFYGYFNAHYNLRRGTSRNSYNGTSWQGLSAMQGCLILNEIASAGNPMGKVYKDGAVLADGTQSNGEVIADSSITETLNIGSRNNGASLPYDGILHELIIYNNPLSTSDRQKVEGYLAWKWGLESNLPSGHPYENAAP